MLFLACVTWVLRPHKHNTADCFGLTSKYLTYMKIFQVFKLYIYKLYIHICVCIYIYGYVHEYIQNMQLRVNNRMCAVCTVAP